MMENRPRRNDVTRASYKDNNTASYSVLSIITKL